MIEKIKEYKKLHAEGENTQTETNEKEVVATSVIRLQALDTLRESEKCWGQTWWQKEQDVTKQWERYLDRLTREEREQSFKMAELQLKRLK